MHKTSLMYNPNLKLTKRLDKRQKRNLFEFVHKNYVFFSILFYLWMIFFTYCANKKQVIEEPLCEKRFNVELFSTHPKDTQFLLKDKFEWYNHYQRKYKIYQEKFKELWDFFEQHPQCRKKGIVLLQEELQLSLKLQEIYYNHLEKDLNQYIKKQQIYEGNKIIEDFRENKNALLESYVNFSFFAIKQLEENLDHRNQTKKWYEVYSILIYELFFQLPEDFKKEWFKKFSY
ncbi:MAG: hypothetical protein N2247_12920 [Leptospiraceae bacterium]|nr:hypothetical protein [Leptospiraceae bacterium]